MSDLSAIGLILGTFIVGFVAANYVIKIVNDRYDEVILGVIDGVPASAKHRTLMLYSQCLPTQSSLAAFTVVGALAYFRAAEEIADTSVRGVAYLCAGLSAWGAIMFVVLGFSHLLYAASILRETKRD
jgi:hypothetical protein